MNYTHAYTPRRMFAPMNGENRGKSSAAPDRDKALRALVAGLQKDQFEGNLAAVARAFRIKGSGTLRDFLRGDKGAGLAIIDGAEWHTRRTIDQIISVGGDVAKLYELPERAPPQRVRFGDLPDWEERLAVVKALAPHVPARYWTMLSAADAWIDGELTNAMLIEMAEFLARHR